MKFRLALCSVILGATALSAAPKSYDLIVAGAGTGGCAASIQAARMGLKVALLEPTGWVGGQMTAAGVTSLDDLRRNRTGLYGEFLNRLRRYYKNLGVNSGICYWGGDTASGSASVEQKILLDMMAEAGAIDLFRHTTVQSVLEENGRVKGVKALTPKGAVEFRAPVTIDATELGDILPMTTARYRVGNSVSPHINPSSSIQDITWVAAIHKRKDGVPEPLKAQLVDEYHAMRVRLFSPIVSPDGKFWGKGRAPYNKPTFDAYRAIPDPDWNLRVVGDKADTWQNVTSTSLNWGNDYPGRKADKRGLPARYLTDEAFRRKANAAALQRTLGLLYYYQNSLGGSDWTVDTRQGYAESGDSPLNVASSVPAWAKEIVANMPPIPYARESRRLVGLYTLRASDIERPLGADRTSNRFSDAVAVGEYPVDIHGSRQADSLEKDLGETPEAFPTKWHAGTFQVPIRCLIPERLDGFLAAEKNISVSRMVNGATRLHPITMLTGQAAGALAALAVKNNLQPRDVPVSLVQDQLLRDRSMLSLSLFSDVPTTSDDWPAAQFAAIAAVKPLGKDVFGASFPVRTQEMTDAVYTVMGLPLPEEAGESEEWAAQGDLRRVMENAAPGLTGWLTFLTDDRAPLRRIVLAQVLHAAAVERGKAQIQRQRGK